MLAKLIAFSLKNSPLVLIIGLLVMFAGVYVIPRMNLDVFPELNAPRVVILTEASGLSADEVEQYVTFPIETAMNGIVGVRAVRSTSALSLSVIYVEFDWDMEIYRARQLVSERLSAVREELPPNTHAEIGPVSSITGEIMLLSLSSPEGTVSPRELRSFAEFDLRNRLLAVPGITQVVAIGGELPEYQVNLSQEKLLLHGLTVQDVVEATRHSHSIASAGYLIDVEGLELPLRQQARAQSIDDIAATTVRFADGSALTLGDVADVRLGAAIPRGSGSESGHPAVVLALTKAPGINTIRITQEVDKALDEVQFAMPQGMVLNRHIFRQAEFIERSISNLLKKLRDATILVAIVLILFLMNTRTTVITLIAIPLSMASTILIFDVLGMTINVMTLGGLAIAIGELVDDAIIDVENVYRRLRENASLPAAQQRPRVQVIYDASNEIRSSIVFATIIICIVFLPLLFLQGIEGRFFRPMALAYILSILASLVIALTITPAMCKHLIKPRAGKEHGDGPLVRLLKRLYAPSLLLAMRLRKTVLGLALVTTIAALALASTFGTSFLPSFNEGTFTISFMAPPGTSLPASDRLGPGVERRIAEIDGVRAVVRRTGRAERDEHAMPPSNSEIDVSLEPGADKETVRREIDEVLASVPGITATIGQPIGHRLSHILSGTPADVAISVFGDDLNILRQIAREVEGELTALPGARDVNANRELMIQSAPIIYRRQDLARYGLTPGEAAEQVQVAFSGEHVATINEGIRRYDLVVRLDGTERERIDQVKDFILRGADGAMLRLSDVADVGRERVSNLITRENARRKAVISLNVAEGSNLGDLVAQVRERVDPIVARYGYSVQYGGQFEAQQSAARTIAVMGFVTLVLVLLLLHAALKSFKAALLVLVNLPLALIGGIAAVYIAETPNFLMNTGALLGFGGTYIAPVLSIASLVGFITLFGIAVRNGILLVNHYAWLQENEGLGLRDAVVRGSMERLVPILMTALTAALALLPVVWAAGQPGSEILAPLAVVVLGGLITSTFLNAIVVPVGYAMLMRKEDPS